MSRKSRGSAQGIMRTGTVASTDNRNWELLPDNQPQRRFSQNRAVALDMESANHRRQWISLSRALAAPLLCVATNRCTVRQATPAWQTISTVNGWISTCASACAPGVATLTRHGAITAASYAAFPRWRFNSALTTGSRSDPVAVG